jgi:hypothetical protein
MCSLRSPERPWQWLLAKEWRELVVSKSWWIMLLLCGPLVGVSFISAVRTYAEASGLGGTAIGVGEAFSPLVGVWAPTFSAYEIVAVFLLPFVTIRIVSGDRQSGALKLEHQAPVPVFTRVAVKALVLLAGWLIVWMPGAIAIVLWLSYGGHTYWPEVAAVAFGHLLNAGLTVALAAAAASVTEHPSTAAIVTLAFTVGTWVLAFVAAVQGAFWERLAGYTPPAVVADFQRGLIQMDVVLIALMLIAAGLAIAAVWMRTGLTVRKRASQSLMIGAMVIAAAVASTFVRANWDASENRQNSFSFADAATLARIKAPLRIEVHLAPEDPRRSDLDRHAISKLRRVMPSLDVAYISATSIGLFEQTNEHYGEIWYEMEGRKTMSRVTTAEGVLESIYELAKVDPMKEDTGHLFTGYPLAHPPVWASTIFYGVWPASVFASMLLLRRRNE